jgi:hypothetical protein
MNDMLEEAKLNGYETIENIGKWHGVDAYVFGFTGDDVPDIGLPTIGLASDPIEIISGIAVFEIIDALITEQ